MGRQKENLDLGQELFHFHRRWRVVMRLKEDHYWSPSLDDLNGFVPRMTFFFIRCCSSSISFSNKDFPLVTLGNLGLVQLLFLGTATLVGGIVFRKLGGFHGCCSDFVSLPCLVGNPVCLSQYQAGWVPSEPKERKESTVADTGLVTIALLADSRWLLTSSEHTIKIVGLERIPSIS